MQGMWREGQAPKLCSFCVCSYSRQSLHHHLICYRERAVRSPLKEATYSGGVRMSGGLKEIKEMGKGDNKFQSYTPVRSGG